MAARSNLPARMCSPPSSSRTKSCLRPYPGIETTRQYTARVNALVLLINGAHQCSCRRKDFVNEDENGLLRRELDTFSNHIYELAHSQILWQSSPSEFILSHWRGGTNGGYKIFLLVDRRNVCAVRLLTNDLWPNVRHLPLPTSVERTGIRSGYFCLIRSASALRFSVPKKYETRA